MADRITAESQFNRNTFNEPHQNFPEGSGRRITGALLLERFSDYSPIFFESIVEYFTTSQKAAARLLFELIIPLE